MDRLAPQRNFLLFTFSLMVIGALLVALQLASPASRVSGDPLPTPTPKSNGGFQGNSHSNPDGGGVDKPYPADGQPSMSQGPTYFDGNNGCGQDKKYDAAPDVQGGYDDNNGHCGKPNTLQAVTSTPTALGGGENATATPTAAANHIAVTICHREGNGSSHEITVDDDAVPAHLAHGDTLGVCVAATTGPNLTATAAAGLTSTPTALGGGENATATPTAAANHIAVTICHREGNGSSHEITVDDDAVPAHLAHGDTLGVCVAATTGPNLTATAAAGLTATASAGELQTATATTPANTATATTVANTATATTAANTATATTVANTATATTVANTATATTEANTATATPSELTVVTETPFANNNTNIVNNNSIVTNQAPTQITVVSGAQGGGDVSGQAGTQGVTSETQGVTSGTQGGGNGAVAGAARLPSTGTGGAGSTSNGMLYFGIALIFLGAGLGGTRILMARR